MSRRKLLGAFAALATAVALAVPSAAVAAGRGPGGGGGGGGGETTVTNNLSTPAVFVGSVGFGLPTPTTNDTLTDVVMPSGTPTSGWEVSGYYYVQGQRVRAGMPAHPPVPPGLRP